MNEILNHLLQSTLFAATVAAANTMLRRNSPRLRYWLWLSASIKFLVPKVHRPGFARGVLPTASPGAKC